MSESDVGPPPEPDAADEVDAADVATSRRRALAAGIGLAVVVATYGPSGLGDSSRWWAAAATILVALALADLLPAVRELLPIPGVAPLTIVAALVAIYLCVPETDQIPVAAIMPVVVVVLELVGRRQVGLEWYAVAAASVLWAGMFGASGSPERARRCVVRLVGRGPAAAGACRPPDPDATPRRWRSPRSGRWRWP